MDDFHDRINLLYEEARDANYKVGRNAFAKMLDVTIGQLSGWLDGLGKPNSVTLRKIALKTNVSVSWLVGETDFRNSSLPDNCDELPKEAQHEYKILMDYLKYKYGLKKRRD